MGGGGMFQDFGMNENEFRNRYQRRRASRQQPQNVSPMMAMFTQFMPIILILSYLVLSSLMVKSQYFSFHIQPYIAQS